MILKLLNYYFSTYYWDKASVDAVKTMQLKKFREVFEYAREHSKFYHKLYKKNGVLDLKIKSWEDIQKVPIVNKTMMREYTLEELMTCEMHSGINIHSTSGSTGEPFRIAYTKFEDYSAHVRLTKKLMQYGYSPFKKLVLLSRYEKGHEFKVEEDIGLIAKLQKRLKMFPKEVISIFEPIEDIIDKLDNIKPFIVWSTPSFIHILALELKRRNRRLEIPLCLLMAETISDFQMKFFKERICLNIIDAYGCMESPSIGFSFNSNEYKDIIPNTTMVEVVNQRSFIQSQIGDIIITSLINKTMPFIRYELGDFVGVLNDRNFPTTKIGRVHGRFDDILHFGNNYSLVFHQTYQLFHGFHEVEQYKFVELPGKEIVLQLKINPAALKTEVKAKVLQIWERYYPEYPLTIEWVDKFEINPETGKFKVLEKIKS